MTTEQIAILGAGTMGAGIAQAALAAGYAVLLYDPSQAALSSAQGRITAGLARQGQAPSALRLAHEPGALAGASLVIEAAPERLDLKRELLAAAGALCPAPCILASNTSSLPIAALASACPGPQRVAGLHFFNPVHRMALVEVVRADQTDQPTLERLLAFVAQLGKTAVVARDTPGFIVNRVARPYYGEALRLLGEQAAAAAVIDTILEQAGGFPLGPFALMDLIGIDVNFAVSESIYQQTFAEPRYRPHPIQQQMVLQGRLGRKTGRGFYVYDQRLTTNDDEQTRRPGNQETRDQETRDPRPETDDQETGGNKMPASPGLTAPATVHGLPSTTGQSASDNRQSAIISHPPSAAGQSASDNRQSAIISSGTWAPAFAALCTAAGLQLLEELPYGNHDLMAAFIVAGRGEGAIEQALILDRQLAPELPIFVQCADISLAEVASVVQHPARLVGFDGLFTSGIITLAATPLLAPSVRAAATALVQALGRLPQWLADTPALVVPRVVAQLANEAAFTLGEGVADAATIDLALRLGANHPQGPLARAEQLGFDKIVAILDHLHVESGEERYRVAPLLRRAARLGVLSGDTDDKMTR